MKHDRKALQRALNRSGLEHVDGWVDRADAAPIKAKIAKHKPRVDAIKAKFAPRSDDMGQNDG